jgi:hypothetical protein
MSFVTERYRTKRDIVVLSLLVSLPFAGMLLLYALSLASLITLIAAGTCAAVVALLMFTYPSFGIFVGVFYLYSGLSFYGLSFVLYGTTLILLLAMCLRLLRGGSIHLRNTLFLWSVIFFALFAIQSMLFSYDMSYSLMFFSDFMKTLLFTFLIVQFIRTPKHLEIFAVVLFVAAVFSIVLGMINMRLGLQSNFNVIGGVKLLRFTGTYQDPNVLALSLVSALPLGVYAIRICKKWFFRVLAILGVAVLIAGAFGTYSRAASFPFAIVLLAVFFRETRGRKSTVLLIPGYYWDRLLSLESVVESSQADYSLYLRLTAIKVALKMFAEHPFTGVGLGNFIARSGSDMFIRIFVHNLYLEILTGTGILGFLSLMLVFGSSIRESLRGVRARWQTGLEHMNSLSFYVLLSFAASLIAALFLSMPFSCSIWTPLAAGLVIGGMIPRTPGRRRPNSSRLSGTPA